VVELRSLLRPDGPGGTEGALSRPEVGSLERSLPWFRQLLLALALPQDAQEFIPHE
jgi:hypothetical protein